MATATATVSDPDLVSAQTDSPPPERNRLSFRKVERIAADSGQWGKKVWGDRLIEESAADSGDSDNEDQVPWLWADDQGRGWGTKSSVTPARIADLISSIGSSGVLQPVLAEKHPNGGLRVVVGHRRLAACRWGLVHVTDPERRERFAELPVVIIDGPLPEAERRNYQLVENLARTDMEPGELAAALLYERCAVFVENAAQGTGKVPPEEMLRTADPAERWQKLLDWRAANCPEIGASWPYVLRRLGMQMGDRRGKGSGCRVPGDARTYPRRDGPSQYPVGYPTPLAATARGSGRRGGTDLGGGSCPQPETASSSGNGR